MLERRGIENRQEGRKNKKREAMIAKIDISKRVFPCGCFLSWDKEDAVIALCIEHSIEYKTWKECKRDNIKSYHEYSQRNGNDNDDEDDDNGYNEDIDDFVKMITTRQKTELKRFDSNVLLEM